MVWKQIGVCPLFTAAWIHLPDKNICWWKNWQTVFTSLQQTVLTTIMITDMNGVLVKQLAKLPSSELAPSGYDNTLNAHAPLTGWIMNPPPFLDWTAGQRPHKKKVDFHDAAFTLAAPLPVQCKRTGKSMYSCLAHVRIVQWCYQQFIFCYRRQPGKNTAKKWANWLTAFGNIVDRSTDDAYNDPGTTH